MSAPKKGGSARRSGSARGAAGSTRRAADSGGRRGRAKEADPRSGPKGSGPGSRPVRRGGPGKPRGRASEERTEPFAGGGAKSSRAAASRGVGGDQVEGRQAVRELLLAGRRKVREIYVSADLDGADIISEILELATEAHVTVKEIGRGRLDALARTDSHQGIVARAAEIVPVDADDLAVSVNGVAPFLLALDGVTDPGNLGALLRSAECAGVTGVLLPRHRSVHITPTVTKAAAGAIEYLPIALVGGLPTAVDRLKKLGVWSVGLDETGPRTLWELASLDEPVVVVMGAEGKGLSRLVRQRCDQIARIPMRGRLASLNVSVAGAMACFEIARARQSVSGR